MKTQINTTRPHVRTMWVVHAALMATAAFWLFAGEAHAQVSFAAEGRVGVTVPQGDLSDRGAETGITLGAELQGNFHPNLTAYLGLSRHAFGCESGCALGSNPTSTGLGAGLKYLFHSPGDVHVWGRGGIIADRLSAHGLTNDRGLGFEVGMGADLPVASRLYLVPSLGFTSHDVGSTFTARFFTLGVGAHYHIN